MADGANSFRNGIIERDGTRTPHYEHARKINAEIKAWAPTLMKLTSTDLYHTGPLPKGCRALSKEASVQVKGDAALVVGSFVHEDGTPWMMAPTGIFAKKLSRLCNFEVE